MTTETERRFVVDPDWALVVLADKPYMGVKQVQGYITTDEKRTSRVRVETDVSYSIQKGSFYSENPTRCLFTLKGKKDENGKGMEIEGSIDPQLAANLLAVAVGTVSKTRYTLSKSKELTVTLDVFQGQNRGLVILEVEGDEKSVKDYPVPSWATREVTNAHEYSCSQLALKPFLEWGK